MKILHLHIVLITPKIRYIVQMKYKEPASPTTSARCMSAKCRRQLQEGNQEMGESHQLRSGGEGRRRGVNPIFSNYRGKSEKHLMQQACIRVQFMALENIVILGGVTFNLR